MSHEITLSHESCRSQCDKSHLRLPTTLVLFRTGLLSQPIRIGPLLTDSLKQIKETLGQLLTGLPRFLIRMMFPSENNLGTSWCQNHSRSWCRNRSCSWYQNRSGSSNASTFQSVLTYLIQYQNSQNKTRYIITYGTAPTLQQKALNYTM